MTKKNSALGVLLVVLLGSLGSALWELALRPLLGYIGIGALEFVTLGLDSLRDGLYERVAPLRQDRFTSAIIAMILALLLAVAGLLLLLYRPRYLPTRTVALIMALNSGMWSYIGIKAAYVGKAAEHIERALTITAPYMSNNELLLMKSRVAQIQNRDDYVKVLGTIEPIAQSNGVYLPNFDVF